MAVDSGADTGLYHLAGVERGGAEHAEYRLQLHAQPAVLAGLAAGLSGATLRIFYSFMVPIFGGRQWTAISTASLLIPAIGIGFAVQDTPTSYVRRC